MAAPACWLLALLLPLGTAQEASSTEPYFSTPILPSSPSVVSEEWVTTEIPGAPIAVMMMTTTTATIHSTDVALSFTGSTSVVSAPQTTVASLAQRTEIPASLYERPSRVRTHILTTEESDMAFPATTENSDILVSVSSPEGYVEILHPTSTQVWNEPDVVTLRSMPPLQSAATTSSPEPTVGRVSDISTQGRLTGSDAHRSSTAEMSSVLSRSTAASVLAVRSSETLPSAAMSSFAEDQTRASEVSTLDEGCASTCHPKTVLATSATPLTSSANLITRAQPTVFVTSMPAQISATRMTDSATAVSDSLSIISVAAAAAAVAPTSSRSPPFSRSQTLLVHLSSSLRQSSEVSASFSSTPVMEFLTSAGPSTLHSDLFVQTSSRRAFDVHPSSQESRVTLQPTLPPLMVESSARTYSQTSAASSDVTYSASTASEALRPASRVAELTAAPASAATIVLEPSGSAFMSSSTPVRRESTVSTTVISASQSVMSPAASETPSSAFGISPNVTPSATAFTASTTTTTTTTSKTTKTTTLASPTASNRSVTAAASTTSTAAGTSVPPTVAGNTSRTVVTRNVTLTTTHPRHPATRTVIRDARYLFKLSGDCHLIVNNTEYFERFLAGFHDLLTKHLHIREEAYKLGDITCGSVHVYVTFLHVPMPHFDGVLQAAVRTGGEELVVPVWMESHFVTFQLVHVQEVAFKSTVETYNIVNEVMDEVDVIVIVVACCVCAVLVAIGVAICVKECYRRKHAQSFDLLEVPHVNLKLEDFTLTRIPRPRPVYTESSGVKVKVKAEASCLNGSSDAHYVSAGSCKPVCVINPENIHVRMASNSEGLVVGITCHPSAVTGCQVDPHLSGTSRKSKSKNRNASGDKHCDEDDEDHQASEKLLGSLCHGGADGTSNPVFVDEPEEGARDSDCGEESD